MYTEELAEIQAISLLSTALSDGMTVLSAQNIARPVAMFAEDLPAELRLVDEFVDRFLTWQRGRITGRANILLWDDPAAKEDARLYVARKVWVKKAESDTIINPLAKTLVAANTVFKKMRGSMREAVGHGVMRDGNVKRLASDIRDEIDKAVAARIDEAMRLVAGAGTKSIADAQADERKAIEEKSER